MSQPDVHITSRGIDRIAAGHPWIYRSDVKIADGVEPGAVVRVLERKGRFWGQALWSAQSQIALRMLTREQRPFDHAFLAERIAQAEAYRAIVAEGTQAYRLVSSEGDLLPSLVVDRYADVCVVQTLSQGMERLKADVVQILAEQFKPRAILERNDVAVRALEGLP
ncbi:MAG TPA: hypothetical protein VKV79_00005, partial [Terriglobia bacterium]|nr:hypothetical protein [Terriglobia bacterium]